MGFMSAGLLAMLTGTLPSVAELAVFVFLISAEILCGRLWKSMCGTTSSVLNGFPSTIHDNDIYISISYIHPDGLHSLCIHSLKVQTDRVKYNERA